MVAPKTVKEVAVAILIDMTEPVETSRVNSVFVFDKSLWDEDRDTNRITTMICRHLCIGNIPDQYITLITKAEVLV